MHVQNMWAISGPSCLSWGLRFNMLLLLKVCLEVPTPLGVLVMQWAACTIQSAVKLAFKSAAADTCQCTNVTMSHFLCEAFFSIEDLTVCTTSCRRCADQDRGSTSSCICDSTRELLHVLWDPIKVIGMGLREKQPFIDTVSLIRQQVVVELCCMLTSAI